MSTPIAHVNTDEHHSCWNGREAVVKLLLGPEDANPDVPGIGYGQTPLAWAAENGRVGIVKPVLGGKYANPDNSNKSGRTPLWCAMQRGHEGIVKLQYY